MVAIPLISTKQTTTSHLKKWKTNISHCRNSSKIQSKNRR